ncbi:hypothetical protein EYM_06540 [Ignicoccus islandicus DSM 13165]|uniref:2-(3-amino-3-carboxypropyl)histidine synthase n=1 Tax=Ignicoccus islandicus DSM 13165 TaxID=940295 RepID=A0A0U3FAJ4_9CREN|nr:diphthamide synthesis protein [Ignicoccus islandicus]ALU12697.1 hypothetical protein EYM_06540 [Ignicoccus islandicus DSM 13165]
MESFLRGLKGRVVVESPPGLWREAKAVCSFIEERGLECVRSAMPSFGACLVFQDLGDAIVHLGHYPYPWWKPSKKTLFLPCPWKGEVRLHKIKSELEGKRTLVGTTAQHLESVKKVIDEMKAEGVNVELSFSTPRGLVLGCDYTGLRRGYDEYLIIAGGKFHSLGASLYLKRDVIAFDPYSERWERVNPYPILKRRLWKVSEAMEGREVAIIDGIEGQSRENLVKALFLEASRGGFKARLFKAPILTKEFVANVLEEVDFAVITSCPRLPLDDYGDLEKPVLAPGEARAVFRRNLELYSFPF